MPPPVTPAGVITRPSPHSVDVTVARITHLVQAKGATVQVSYNSPEYLIGRHRVPPHLAAALHAVEAVAAAVTAP